MFFNFHPENIDGFECSNIPKTVILVQFSGLALANKSFVILFQIVKTKIGLFR